MLKLVKQDGPEWREALGARFLFAPITRSAYRRARRAGFEAMKGMGEDSDAHARSEAGGDAVSISLMMEGLLDWEGVGDDDGNVLPCTPETKAMLLADPPCFDALDALYVMPFVLRVMEGNGSAPSPNGTGGAVMPVKAIAVSNRASRRKRAAAKPAPTASTNSRPPKAKRPGKS